MEKSQLVKPLIKYVGIPIGTIITAAMFFLGQPAEAAGCKAVGEKVTEKVSNIFSKDESSELENTVNQTKEKDTSKCPGSKYPTELPDLVDDCGWWSIETFNAIKSTINDKVKYHKEGFFLPYFRVKKSEDFIIDPLVKGKGNLPIDEAILNIVNLDTQEKYSYDALKQNKIDLDAGDYYWEFIAKTLVKENCTKDPEAKRFISVRGYFSIKEVPKPEPKPVTKEIIREKVVVVEVEKELEKEKPKERPTIELGLGATYIDETITFGSVDELFLSGYKFNIGLEGKIFSIFTIGSDFQYTDGDFERTNGGFNQYKFSIFGDLLWPIKLNDNLHALAGLGGEYFLERSDIIYDIVDTRIIKDILSGNASLGIGGEKWKLFGTYALGNGRSGNGNQGMNPVVYNGYKVQGEGKLFDDKLTAGAIYSVDEFKEEVMGIDRDETLKAIKAYAEFPLTDKINIEAFFKHFELNGANDSKGHELGGGLKIPIRL